MKRLLLEALSLQTARGRVLVFVLASVVIFCCRYHWLDHLSLWGHLGFTHAPSIGLTRAYWLLLHGHPVDAWHRNRLIYAVLGVGLPLILRDVFKLARRTASTSSPETVL